MVGQRCASQERFLTFKLEVQQVQVFYTASFALILNMQSACEPDKCHY